jgi:hypothetical protein
MTGWGAAELDRMDRADELQVASHRPDGSLRPFVTIWFVRVDDALYVRSAHGPANGWFRRAQSSGTGRVRAGGAERDVAFVPADAAPHDEIDAAYRRKYARYPGIVGSVVGPKLWDVTLRLDAR